jgi:ABC-type transport system involved in cytochrome bd biosynthesis fused ATPase/permease subunit
MKKTGFLLSMMLLLTTFMAPAMANNDTKKDKIELTAGQKVRLNEIETRVAEIKSLDFKDMSNAERKEIRDELRGMKKEANALDRGIYISVGAIIVILLLLILLT